MGHPSFSSQREWVTGGVIGVGAFGTVSLALEKATGELLAVKSIECKGDRKGELLSMENEINILTRLDSPWIVKFLGANYSEDGGVCRRNLLMEYMPGGSVSDVVEGFGGKLEESVIKVYTRGILRGIEYLHSQGIVHSDIKGKNVLVGSAGVKLADFGSAKVVGSEEGSKVGLSGTPLWMAPEVINQVERGPPCDIWSLGCTVVEMTTGRPPWSNIDHPLAAMYKIGCSDELPEFPKSLSVEGHDFLDKCFRRDSKQRWTSAQLLTHPFVTQCIQQEPESLTSTLDFHSVEKEWDESGFCATFSRTIPVLSSRRKHHSPMQGKEEEAGHSDSEAKTVFEESPCTNSKPSPRQRMTELAEKNSSGTRPNWSLSPDSNWIVIRSPKDGKPPMLDTSFTDFDNCSLAQSTTSTQTSQADCGASSQISGIICEDLSGTDDEYVIDGGHSKYEHPYSLYE